jgi:hypothetical protein
MRFRTGSAEDHYQVFILSAKPSKKALIQVWYFPPLRSAKASKAAIVSGRNLIVTGRLGLDRTTAQLF